MINQWIGQIWIPTWLVVAVILGLQAKTMAVPVPEEQVVQTQTTETLEEIPFSLSPSFPDLVSDEEPPAQVTSVSQLQDVQPTDWAFQALQTLVERYDCLAGYPDQMYRGNRVLSRYEFAGGVNACVERVSQLITQRENDPTVQEDLLTLQKLQQEFINELSSLQARVASLETRSEEIQAQQFSPTTRLTGISIFGFQTRSFNRADINPRDGSEDTDDPLATTNFVQLTQFYLTSVFSPRSYLWTGLLSTNTGSLLTGLTNDGIPGYAFPGGEQFTLTDANFRWLITDNFAVMVGPQGVNMFNAFRGPNRVESGATGPLSLFAQRNPILNIGFAQGGIAFDWQFAKRASLQAVYSSFDPGSPGERQGLFDGITTTGVQFLLTPADVLDISLYYVNNYSPNGRLLTAVGDSNLTAVNPITGTSEPLQTNAIGTTINWQIAPWITLGGWAGYTNSFIPGKSGNVETMNYMVYLNFPDLFKKGNLGGIYVGQPPRIISSDLPEGNNVPDFISTGLGRSGGQPGTTTHLEIFYRFQVTDNISLTPGIIQIFQPGHTPDSDPFTIGILRTTFIF